MQLVSLLGLKSYILYSRENLWPNQIRINSLTLFPYYLAFSLPHTCHTHKYMIHIWLYHFTLNAAGQQEKGLSIL